MNHILQVLTEKYVIVEMSEPYIAGFLAFREVDHLLKCIEQLHAQDSMPQVCMHVCDVTLFIVQHKYLIRENLTNSSIE